MSYTPKNYFPRPELKFKAKEMLRGHWLPAVIVAALFLIFNSAGTFAGMKVLFPETTIASYFGWNASAMNGRMFETSLDFSNVDMVLLLAVVLIVGVMINGIFQMAASVWFLYLAQGRGEATVGEFFSHFGYWLNGVLMYLWMTLWMLIWVILPIGAMVALSIFMGPEPLTFVVFSLLIGAISVYKGAQYSLCFYALADEPEIGVRQALRASVEATRHHVGDIVLTAISFIGWYILGSLIPPVNLYVYPYVFTTYANIWLHLRNEAFDNGVLNPVDFGLQAVEQPENQSYSTQVNEGGALSEPAPHVDDRTDALPDASEKDIQDFSEAREENEENHQ